MDSLSVFFGVRVKLFVDFEFFFIGDSGIGEWIEV